MERHQKRIGKITLDKWIMCTIHTGNGRGHRHKHCALNLNKYVCLMPYPINCEDCGFQMFILCISNHLNLVKEHCTMNFICSLLTVLLLILQILFFISEINFLHLFQFHLKADCLKVKRYKVFHSYYCIISSDLQITFHICLGQNYKAAQRFGQEDSSDTVNLISREIKSQLSLHFYSPRRKLKNTLVGLTK